MYYWQNDLLGCIFGEIIAMPNIHQATANIHPIIDNSTSKIAKFTSILLRKDKKTSYILFLQRHIYMYLN